MLKSRYVVQCACNQIKIPNPLFEMQSPVASGYSLWESEK
jgi:hypothetical protein